MAERRLVPRHIPISRIEMTWTSTRPAKWFKRKPSPVTATVLDVAAKGMLMELPLEPKADLGDIVALSSKGNDAVATVVHTDRDMEFQRVGVEITEMSPEFAAELNAVVAAGEIMRLPAWCIQASMRS